jgi:glutamine phosphoribosylpyrophosphate amidotransferase
MADRIIHRGPDQDDYYVDDDISLGFRRLSIIDIEGGSQPLQNADGSMVLVFNGEIYNYKDLRIELEEKGYIVRIQNEQDKREFHVKATGRYREEYGEIFDYIHKVCERIEERFSPEEVENFSRMLGIISEELMPEAGTRLRERDIKEE